MKVLLSILVLIILCFFIFEALPFEYGKTIKRDSDYYLEHGRSDTGALNMITAIYLDYRAYDTLGEATVFFATALGVFMLLAEKRKDEE